MATFGRVSTAKNNIVTRLPTLPKNPVFGSFNISCSFESHPTGSIEINHIPETQIKSYRAAYRIGRTFSAYSYYFVVAGRAETVDFIPAIDGLPPIKTYKMTVQLEGGFQQKATANIRLFEAKTNRQTGLDYISLKEIAREAGVRFVGFNHRWLIEDKKQNQYGSFESKLQERLRLEEKIMDWTGLYARAKDYKRGMRKSVSRNDIQYSIELSRSAVKSIKDGIITYSGTDPKLRRKLETEKNLQNLTTEAGEVEKIAPEVVTVMQGDVEYQRSPSDVRFATDLSLTHDGSGPRRSVQISKTIGGQPLEDTNITYSFEYVASDIEKGNDFDRPLQGVPTWKKIEQTVVSYGYQKQTASVRITVRNKNTNELLSTVYREPEGYGGIKAYYLMQVKTTGSKRGRFIQESLGGDADTRIVDANLQGNLEPLDAEFYNLQNRALRYRNLPINGIKGFTMKPMYQIYPDYEEIPFQTQTGKLSDIDAKITPGSPSDKTIVYATPDVNYVMPYGVLEEHDSNQSFASMRNPQNVYIKDERIAIKDDTSLSAIAKEAELNATPLLPKLTTGEDTYKRTTRVIKNTDNEGKITVTVGRGKGSKKDKKYRYTEYEQVESFHDDGFKNGFQTTKFREVVGQVPTASYYTVQYQPVDKDEKKDDTEKEKKREIYSVGVRGETIAEVSQTFNYDVKTLKEALRIAECELSLENFNSGGNDQVNLAWFYPNIKPDGCYLSIPDDRGNRGRKRVKSVNFTIQFQGFFNGSPLVTCDGTQVTLGNWDKHNLRNKRYIDLTEDEDGGNGEELDIKPRYYASSFEFDENEFDAISSRRNV